MTNEETFLYDNRKRNYQELQSNMNETENYSLKQKLDEENKRFLTKNKFPQGTGQDIKLNNLSQARLIMKNKKNIENISSTENIQISIINSNEITITNKFSLNQLHNNDKNIFRQIEIIFGFNINIQILEMNKKIEFFKKNDKHICHFQLILDHNLNSDSFVEYVPINNNLKFDDEEDEIFCNERIHIVISDLPFIISKFYSKF